MTWREYATLAGQLEGHRTVQAAQASGHADARRELGAELTAVQALLDGQRGRLSTLYEKLDLPDPVLSGPPPDIGDPHEALRRARDAAERAGSQLTAVESGARRSPVLAHWSTNLRNALVYGCASAAVFLLNLLLFATGWTVLGVICTFVLPFVAFGLGRTAIGFLFTPALGGRAPRTRALGLAICLTPILPLCALWGINWTAGG